MDEENELWELVRQRVNRTNEKYVEEKELNVDKENITLKEDEEFVMEENTIQEEEEPKITIEPVLREDFSIMNLLNEGIFAGFVYIFVIMIVLGVLTIPGSVTAAIGGFFGGKKAGNPARAMTAAMLPFILIASLYFLASTGALPPGSGPNDVANIFNEFMDNNIDDSALGPISKMPDSNSSVFISVVTFAFIGGLIRSEERMKKNAKT